MLGPQRKAEEGVIQSSIALLQERFKQLQRVKEMREKRQVVENFSTHNINNNTLNNNNITTSCITISTTNNSSPTMTNSSTMLYGHLNHNNCDLLLSIDNDDDSNIDNELHLFRPPNYDNHSSYQSSSSLLNNNNTQDDVSLSPWLPLTPSATQLQSAREYYTHSHVSDVDTTLHL